MEKTICMEVIKGFDKVVWKAIRGTGENFAAFKNGFMWARIWEEGYPGSLEYQRVTVHAKEVQFFRYGPNEATTDKKTPHR